LLDANFEDFESDSTVFRTQLYQLLDGKIELNFNRENFRDELNTFEEFKREPFEQGHRNGELKLFPEAVLGIFPQAGSQLVPDYLQLIESNAFQDLESFFQKKNISHDDLSDASEALNVSALPIKEEKIFAPFDLDAYQENAIKAIKHGNSIVVQGPPGTGKSQLICNILSDAMAAGKKALLVCQKRAALDVVYSRLQSIGLGDFLGLVHDFRNDRKEIFEKISAQIDHIEEYRALNRTVDVIQTERKFFQVCRRIDQISEELQEFKQILFDDQECGLSVKELYLTCDPQEPAINIKQEYQYFTFSTLHEFLRKMKMYLQYAAKYELQDYVWRERKSFAGFQPSDEKEMEKILAYIPKYQQKIGTTVEKEIGIRLNLHDCESLSLKEDDILGMISVLKDDETYRYFQAMWSEDDGETSLLWLSNVERVAMSCFDGENPETTIPNNQLGIFQEALQHRMDARTNFFRWIIWELFSKEKGMVKQALLANGLAYNKIGLNILEQRIDSRLNLEHHLTSLKKKEWLINVPLDYQKSSLESWFEKQKLATRAKLIFNTLREIKEAVVLEKYSRQEFISLMRRLLFIVNDIPAKKNEWLKYLTRYQISQLIYDPTLEKEFIKTLKRDFDNLAEYDKLKEGITFHEKEVITKLYDHLETWDDEQMAPLFQNSLRLTWIDHIETKYPILRAVSSMKMETLQNELQELVAEKQNLCREIALVRVREYVYERLEYNRLNNLITYRDLQHQVTKKKKLWPLRRLISEFHSELFQLMPCWMASPESVSAIFPMTELFDIVIFDEASQCFSERGIPAMYRGKQILIAGDDKQLRPSELYQARWDEENENPDIEVESLLELAKRYLSNIHLQGHYRSQSIELIDFSNRHFYDGRLQLMPHRDALNQGDRAIEYCKVEGVWENHINTIEAATIVEKVFAILQQHPKKAIGVVTFNAPQQMHVMDLLEGESARSGRSIPDSLFVKNIENVQGDEKDIIIFSIGYAPDKKGKMSMQFGTLNSVGGENRLNVAVTRAREKIILVTSIWPEQLRTQGIKNEGPKLLKHYLQYAREVDQGNFKSHIKPPLTKNKDWYLSSRIKKWGEERLNRFVFETESLPFSDVGVLHGSQHLGIILTDDIRYFSSMSAKHSHAYIPAILTQKNWKYHMVFSRNFWKDREKIESGLMVFIGSQAAQKG
jgi:MoxR-like ATPase